MRVYADIMKLENENEALKRQVARLEEQVRNATILDDWNLVKTWAASFGVRFLIVGGAFFFFIVLPSAFLGGA